MDLLAVRTARRVRVRDDRAFTLLEAVLAAALLAVVVATCAELLRAPASHPRPVLLSTFPHDGAKNASVVARFESLVGESIAGRWVTTKLNRRIMLVWQRSVETRP